MKKRLLSAVLALAMVLTLLPVSAFAATGDPPSGYGATIRYLTTAANPNNASITADGWYEVRGSGAATTYDAVSTGVVTNTAAWANNASGKWYSTVNEALADGASNIKLIANVTETSVISPTRNITIDLNGKTWSATNGINVYYNYTNTSGAVVTNPANSLTIQDNSVTRGTVNLGTAGIQIAPGAGRGFGKNMTVTLNNVVVAGKIEMCHAGSGKVDVKNASVSGEINLHGIPAANGTTAAAGTVAVDGSTASTGVVRLYPTALTPAYVVTGGSVSVTGGATVAGITVDTTACSAASRCVYVYNSAVTNGITVNGDGTYTHVESSRVGDIKVFGRKGDNLTDAQMTSLAAPKVVVTGLNAQASSIVVNTAAGTEALTKEYTVEVSNNANVSGAITMPTANITVNGGGVGNKTTLGRGTLTLGASNNYGQPTNLAAIDLGSEATNGQYGSATLTVAGTNVTTGAIAEVADNTKTITVNIPGPGTGKFPTDDTNKFVSVTPVDFTKWNKKTINGGHFTTAIGDDYIELLNDLQYLVTDSNYVTSYTNTYWKGGQIDKLVEIYRSGAAGTTVKAVNVATGDDTATLTLNVHQPATVPGVNPPTTSGPQQTTAEEVLKLTFKAAQAYTFTLPSVVNRNKVNEWTSGNGDTKVDTPIPGGGDFPIMGVKDGKYVLNADSVGFRVTKVNNVAVDLEENPTVTAVLSNGVITLSGAASTPIGNSTATITLKLQTDAGEYEVGVAWNTTNNTLLFTDPNGLRTLTGGSLYFADGMKALQLSVNNSKITLKNGGLREEASMLQVAGNTSTSLGGITTTVTDPKVNTIQRQNLAKEWTIPAGITGSPVDFSASPAVLQRLGAVLAGIDNKQVESWLRTARQQAYRAQNNNKNATTEGQLQDTGYDRVVAVLYMNVNVSSIGNQIGTSTAGGLLTATMTPYVRIEAQHGAYNAADWEKNPPIIVRQGSSLGVLSGEVGEVEVTIPKTTVVSNFLAAPWAHQNGTYVYPVTAGGAATNSGSFTLTHRANSGDGFGTIVINSTPAPVELLKYDEANSKYVSYDDPQEKLYDTLQPAIDDSVNNDCAVVNGLSGDHPITVTGIARTVFVDIVGNATISNKSGNGVIITEGANNHTYTVQLTRDNIVKPTEKSVTISTAAAANGSAGLSASKADPGETITVTTSPKAGYGTSGLTIRTNTGATVAYTSTATNRYTFKVPEGVTSITVTPAFAVNGDVAINVASAANGSASTNASGGKVKGGTTVTVTTRPNSGYTTLAVSAVTNTGSSVSVSRVAENTYTFVAPVNATSVTVTPSFTASAHPFIDVAPSHWANNAVGFVYRHGLMKGAGSSVIFAGTTNISRADLVLILYRLSGEPYSSTYSKFNDVAPTAYYAAAVNWASTNNIVTGGTGNNFYPKTDISRQDLASILYRYNNYRRGSSSGSSSLAGFVDSGLVSSYAVAPMQWAVGNGVVNGSGNSLMPRGTASRYEAAQMLMNYCQRFLNMR